MWPFHLTELCFWGNERLMLYLPSTWLCEHSSTLRSLSAKTLAKDDGCCTTWPFKTFPQVNLTSKSVKQEISSPAMHRGTQTSREQRINAYLCDEVSLDRTSSADGTGSAQTLFNAVWIKWLIFLFNFLYHRLNFSQTDIQDLYLCPSVIVWVYPTSELKGCDDFHPQRLTLQFVFYMQLQCLHAQNTSYHEVLTFFCFYIKPLLLLYMKCSSQLLSLFPTANLALRTFLLNYHFNHFILKSIISKRLSCLLIQRPFLLEFLQSLYQFSFILKCMDPNTYMHTSLNLKWVTVLCVVIVVCP